jgi:hypothetical protein
MKHHANLGGWSPRKHMHWQGYVNDGPQLGVETDTDVALDTDKARGLNRFSYSRLFFIWTVRIDVRIQI